MGKGNLMILRTERVREGRDAKFCRQGGAAGVVIVLLVIVGVVAGGFYWRNVHSNASKQVNLIYATVERGTFIHEVNGKGSAESAKNVDVASQVEGSATVIYLIPEGSDVKKGELLVELDSSDVDEKLDSQVVTTNSSRATLNSSRATLRSAEISLEEYVEGTFEQSWMEYASSIFDAEQTRKQKADITRFTERLLNLDYSTELQYEIDKVAEENAKNTLEVTNLKKMTLLKYTSEKQITSLMSDIETARAKVDSDKNSYNINLNRENRYRAQSANCKIRAPQDGQVVYANQDSRRMSEADMIKEGSTVRQRQVLIRLPDKAQMQVKTMINESNISSVKVDMPAKITFDSMPNRVVNGIVTKVNLYPEIVWMSSAKDYVTLVRITEEVPELRSGLTAQVRIIAEEQPDVLMVPVQCVTEYGNKTYCITYKDGVWGCKEVLLGSTNEKQVVILEGLNEGDVVVSGARLYRDNVVFPPIDAPSEYENSEIYQQRIAEREATESKQKEIESGKADSITGRQRPGGIPGGIPGSLPEGVSPADIAKFTEGVPPAELAKIAAKFGFGGGRPNVMSNDDLENRVQREEEAAEYSKTIEEKLERDAKVAAIQPFFTRTVMEMQRELLSAITKKTEDLQAKIAARQNEITIRQDEIELLQKAKPVDGLNGDETTVEDAETRITKLIDEIKFLRGDSDAEPLERISYLDQIDWNSFVSGNDITSEALDFLVDGSRIFEQMFPNSKSIDVTGSAVDSDIELKSSGVGEIELLKRESDSRYKAFKPLFEYWDTNSDGRLKPTEFVIGFFSDRKSFQDSETNEDIDKLFEEYWLKDDVDATSEPLDEVALEDAMKVADKILRERIEVDARSVHGGGRGKGGFPGAPNPMAGNLSGLRDSSNGDSISVIDVPADGKSGKSNDFSVVTEMNEQEPIVTLAEAVSLRQAVALYISQMDFNSDGILQKSEFVKGCTDIKDVAGKLFTSASLNMDSGAGLGMGRMGPPR